MAYCTTDDIEKMLPEADIIRLTDDEASGSINTTRLQEAIDSGAEEIDLYLGVKFALPVTGTVPAILGKVNVDIAIWNLYGRVKLSVPEMRKDRYKAAIDMLKAISKGDISIGLQPIPDAPAEGGYVNASRVSVRDKDFDSTTMDKF